MSEPGIKLTTYFDERKRYGGRFLADALFDIYERHQMRTSVLLRGIEGYSAGHGLHTERLLTLSESLPVASVAVDGSERIERAVPDLLELGGHGVTTLERAQLAAGDALARLTLRETGDDRLLKLTVYGGRAIRAGGQAGYVAAVDVLQAAGAVGASVLLGVDGTLHGARRRAKFFARNAGVPLMLLAIGSAAALQRALPRLAELVEDPVVTVERVRVCRSAGVRIAELPTVAERDPSGLPIWQKLMIHVEEQARHDGHPVYVQLVRRLREADAAGATVLRAVRGFYSDHAPFADRMLSIRRNVPVIVIVVDTPANVRRFWPVVDEVTAESGLVTAELVPGSHGLGSGTSVARLASPPS